MSFYIMRQDTLVPGSRSVDALPDNIDPSEWIHGKLMQDPQTGEPPVLDLSLQSGNYRGHIIDSLITLYHKSLRKALEGQGVDNITYHPVRLRDQNSGNFDDSYFIANILGVIDCVDMSRSKVKWWASGRGFDFLSMVLDEAKTNGAKLFRLKDDPTKVIINEGLYQYFANTSPLAGVKLIKTEDYKDF